MALSRRELLTLVAGSTALAACSRVAVHARSSATYQELHEKLNPGNSAPVVAWLASDEALHVTGQVFRAVGDEIAHYLPWRLGPSVKAGREPQRWEAAEIGDRVNTTIFGSGIGGLDMSG